LSAVLYLVIPFVATAVKTAPAFAVDTHVLPTGDLSTTKPLLATGDTLLVLFGVLRRGAVKLGGSDLLAHDDVGRAVLQVGG
jgi:hypothetical protein